MVTHDVPDYAIVAGVPARVIGDVRKRQMIKVGVIGYGYWGPNLVRNFMAAPGSTVTPFAICARERLSSLRKLYPSLKTCSDAS